MTSSGCGVSSSLMVRVWTYSAFEGIRNFPVGEPLLFNDDDDDDDDDEFFSMVNELGWSESVKSVTMGSTNV